MTDVQGVRRLAAKLVKYDERLLALEAAPQLGHSSVNIGGEDYVIPDLLGVLRENDEEVREAMAEVAADLASAEETLRLANEELADARQELTGLQTELDTARDDITAANEELTQAKDDLAANATEIENTKDVVEGVQTTLAAAQADISENATALDQAKAELDENTAQLAAAAERVAANEQAVADAQQAVADAQAEVAAIGNVAELAQALADEAKNTALAAQVSADGKTKVFYQASAPSTGGRTVGDTWFDTDNGNCIYRWSGTSWVAAGLGSGAIADAAITNAKIANLDAAKITTGTLDAARIAASSITASKLVLSDSTNLVEDPYFTRPFGETWTGLSAAARENLSIYESDEGPSLRLVAAGADMYGATVNRFAMTSSDRFRIYARVANQARDAAGALAQSSLQLRFYKLSGAYVGTRTLNLSQTTAAFQSVTFESVAPTAGAEVATLSIRVPPTAVSGQVILRFPQVLRQASGELIVDGAITSDKIAANAITAREIKAGEITTAALAANAVTAAKIAAGTITASEIAANAITAAKIAAGAVTSDAITAAAITGVHISAGSISASKLILGDSTNLVGDPTFTQAMGAEWSKISGDGVGGLVSTSQGMAVRVQTGVRVDNNARFAVQAGDRLVVRFRAQNSTDMTANVRIYFRTASGGSSGNTSIPIPSGTSWTDYAQQITVPSSTEITQANFSVVGAGGGSSTNYTWMTNPQVLRAASGELIVDGAITADKIAANAVTAAKIAALSISSDKIVANAITSDKIVANAITSDKIVANAITAEKIVALSIGADHLAVNSVTADKIVALAVTADKIAANAVTADKIVSNAITAGKIASNAVTAAKIAANAITAAKIAGGAIDGMVITGATVRTASAGARIEMLLDQTDVGQMPSIAVYGPDAANALARVGLGGTAGQNLPNISFYDESGAVQAAVTNRGLMLANDGDITLRAGSGTLDDAIAGERYARIYRPLSTGGIQIDGGADSAGFASLRMDYLSDGGRINLIGIYGRTTTNSANMFIATAGNIARSTSLKRAKVDVQDQDSDLALLSVPFRSWVDRQNMVDVVLGRRAYPGPRVVGVVAEELERVAPELCAYDESGALQGVAYDRIGPALIPIIRTLVNRVEQLEGAPVTAWTDSPVYDDTELLDEITAYGANATEEVMADAAS